MDIELTEEEREAIASLKRLASKWPDTLWLYATGSGLNVMRKDETGQHATEYGGIDPNYIVDTVDGIDNDGGDW